MGKYLCMCMCMCMCVCLLDWVSEASDTQRHRHQNGEATEMVMCHVSCVLYIMPFTLWDSHVSLCMTIMHALNVGIVCCYVYVPYAVCSVTQWTYQTMKNKTTRKYIDKYMRHETYKMRPPFDNSTCDSSQATWNRYVRFWSTHCDPVITMTLQRHRGFNNKSSCHDSISIPTPRTTLYHHLIRSHSQWQRATQ